HIDAVSFYHSIEHKAAEHIRLKAAGWFHRIKIAFFSHYNEHILTAEFSDNASIQIGLCAKPDFSSFHFTRKRRERFLHERSFQLARRGFYEKWLSDRKLHSLCLMFSGIGNKGGHE